jgi:hypothetical protein
LARYTFNALPRRPSTAVLVHDAATWHGTTLQLATDVRRDYYFHVRVPRLADVVDVVLSEVVNQHRLSDKGKIGTALQASKDIATLLQSGTYEAVVELTTPRAAQLSRQLRNLHADGVTINRAVADQLVAEWGHRGERRYRDASQVSNRSAGALETLVDQQWAERGFEIACTDCGIGTFVPVADVPTRGPAETLTVLRLGVPPTLARTLRSTNIESIISIARTHCRGVKHWQHGQKALRWCAAGLAEAGKQFRRINGHLHLPALRHALERHVTAENVSATRHNKPVIAA